jgi:hypothetical protein
MPVPTARINISGPLSDQLLEGLSGKVHYATRTDARKAIKELFIKFSQKGFKRLTGGLGVQFGETIAEIV